FMSMPTTTTSINVTSATSLNRIVKPSVIHINVNVTMDNVTFTFMWMIDGFTIRFNDVADVTFIEVVVVGLVLCGAIATVFANSNLAIILITGITGYGVAILFVLYRAPDLALTQLVIETVSIVLFLLVYRHLPKLKKRTEPVRTKTVNLIISI